MRLGSYNSKSLQKTAEEKKLANKYVMLQHIWDMLREIMNLDWLLNFPRENRELQGIHLSLGKVRMMPLNTKWSMQTPKPKPFEGTAQQVLLLV